MSEAPVTKLSRVDGFQFSVQFDDDARTKLLMDEPEPLGKGAGPNASRVLSAAVGDCLAASLLFCLSKARVEVGSMEVSVQPFVARNEEGYWRVRRMTVKIIPSVKGDPESVQRCLSIFEKYCVVTGSIRGSIEVEVTVLPRFSSTQTEASD